MIAAARGRAPALPSDASVALAMAARAPRRRPALFLAILGALVVANLFRFWIGAAGGSDDAPLVQAAGWLFLVLRTFGNLWLHVAAMRLVDRPGTPWRAAFAILPLQPGFARVLLRERPVSLGWSLRAMRGQYRHCWALAMTIAYPPALLRMLAFGGIRQDDALSVLATAPADGAMSLVLLATAVYLIALRRAEARGD